MKKSIQKRKLISVVLFVLMTINLLSPVALATEDIPEKVVAKPLVIMMEYQDYKFSDIDTKETEWRLRKVPGDKYTPEFVYQMMFGEDCFTEDIYEFMTLRNYYEQVSGGRFSFQGQVVGPYTAKHEAAYYGSDRNEDGSDQDEAMLLVREAIQAVAQDPNVDLEEFDVENRTGDGQFGVSDGVIDTVIVIHPGIGEEWGGGSLEEAAIWPFRCGFSWYTENNYEMEKVVDHSGKEWYFDDFVLIAQDSAVDMLLHEYGHVMGLPDLYGFSGSNPPVNWWCIMGGSYTGKDIAGSMPISYGGYSREFLQNSFLERKVENPKWANYDEVNFLDIGKDGLDLELHQAHERLDEKTDLFRINLPEKETVITTPTSGEYAYFSGKGNDLRNYMKTTIDLTDYEKAKLEFKAWYKIDPYFDFATVRVNEVGSEEWETVEGNITTTEFDEWLMENETEEERLERNPGYGITAESEGWVDAEFDLSKYVGKEMENEIYHKWSNGAITKDPHQFMVPEFDDNKDYTFPTNAESGLILPNYGMKVLVTEEASDRSSAKIHIMNSKLKNNSVNYNDGLNVKNIKIKDNTIEVQAENKGSKGSLGEKAYISYIKKDDKGNIIEAKEQLVLVDGVYKCSTDFLKEVEKGKYQINFIILEDAEGNARAIYNSKVHYGYGTNLSSGDINTGKK